MGETRGFQRNFVFHKSSVDMFSVFDIGTLECYGRHPSLADDCP